ncbi:MAG: hypothetical protein JJLCMIEE_01258 [Acidimicrobiales bacterium]|nr:MAG: hypothetical protein EDR02_07130 [Actinomycetota bacterium]MBV6508198.1 hypothetical protein [Acidimicrobiales bacterium]RIK07273.1 MAG: hypothetical protein DCC48_04120 [Acidobacteriota bacterium]
MSETERDSIAELKAEVGELRERMAELNKKVLDAQLEAWRSRFDELDLQTHLGGMDLRDKVQPILDQLNDQWAKARAQLDEMGSGAGEAAKAINDAVQSAVDEFRAGFKKALEALRT